ncbi:MAG: hypothetical protein ABIF87_09875 [Pseudomonadota bacterium]
MMPWSLIVLALLGLGAASYAVYRRYSWRRASQTMFIGLVFIGSFLAWHYWPEKKDGDAVPPPAPASPAIADTTTVIIIEDEWSSAYVVPTEAIGAKITWTLLDAKGETDCYQVRLSQGEFRMCPGQKFAGIDGTTSFIRFKMEQPQEAPREIVVRVSKS